MTQVPLETWYRRLLLAYPGHYRRRHGSEILTTLIETARPGRRRPGRAEVADLLLSGLRQRFRLPSRRPAALLAAVLAVLAFGAFGAAAGSWAGERTFPALPSAAEVDRISGLIAGRSDGVVPAGDVLSSTARIIGGSTGPITAPDWPALTADGWQQVSYQPATGTDGCTGELVAARDGLVLRADECHGEYGVAVKTTIFSVRSGAYLPLVAVGAIAGALFGWLLVAGVAYRARNLPPLRRALIGLLAGGGLLAAALPLVAMAGNARHLFGGAAMEPVHVLHAPLLPSFYFSFGPHRMLAAATVVALVCAAGAVVVSRGRAAEYADRAPLAG